MSALAEEPAVSSAFAAQCVDELQRVTASETFSKAARLCALLTYICERSVAGQHDELTEQQIGIRVFQRTPGYNSSEDTIVRGNVRHLRHRLAMYYISEGVHDPIRIEIPKGGYVAQFIAQGQEAASAPPIPSPVSALPPEAAGEISASPHRHYAKWLLYILAALILLGFSSWVSTGTLRLHPIQLLCYGERFSTEKPSSFPAMPD